MLILEEHPIQTDHFRVSDLELGSVTYKKLGLFVEFVVELHRVDHRMLVFLDLCDQLTLLIELQVAF